MFGARPESNLKRASWSTHHKFCFLGGGGGRFRKHRRFEANVNVWRQSPSEIHFLFVRCTLDFAQVPILLPRSKQRIFRLSVLLRHPKSMLHSPRHRYLSCCHHGGAILRHVANVDVFVLARAHPHAAMQTMRLKGHLILGEPCPRNGSHKKYRRWMRSRKNEANFVSMV